MFIASLESVELKPEQKTAVEGIESDLAKLGEQHKEIGSKLANDVADGAEAGKIDHKKTDADIKEIVKAIEGTVPATQDAMTRLYKTLDAAQRKQLVETMRAKAKEMGEHGMGEHGMDEHHGEHGKGEHGDHGKGEPGEHGKGEHAAGEHHGDHGPMHELGELELTAEQREKIHTKIEAEMKAQEASKKQQMEATKKHMDAIGDAFASDKFDAKKLGVGKQAPEMAKKMATMRVKMAEIVTGVLTPEQRTKFAAHIREHAGDPD
jgi:Spy/CpxP family protein refolding chaperone